MSLDMASGVRLVVDSSIFVILQWIVKPRKKRMRGRQEMERKGNGKKGEGAETEKLMKESMGESRDERKYLELSQPCAHTHPWPIV